MGHNVGDAAANAVKRSERKAAAEQTLSELISELRKNLKMVPTGFVPTHQIFALLSAFDAEQEFSHKLAMENLTLKDAITALSSEKQTMIDTIFGLTEKVQAQEAKIDEFRSVYEEENSRIGVLLEKVDAPVELHRLDDDGGAQS